MKILVDEETEFGTYLIQEGFTLGNEVIEIKWYKLQSGLYCLHVYTQSRGLHYFWSTQSNLKIYDEDHLVGIIDIIPENKEDEQALTGWQFTEVNKETFTCIWMPANLFSQSQTLIEWRNLEYWDKVGAGNVF